ncbi:MAG TPA: Ada metal-binding domain-containing protein [Bryobacteraceae bacterium]|nr:Ada metal-binding domain-containing protein [Bryobacteraceae bacterium]
MTSLFLESGQPLALGQKLGSGGEAAVFAVLRDPARVAKIYHRANHERVAKLGVMLRNPPDDPTSAQGHTSICWPQHLVVDGSGATVGFVMSRVDSARSIPVFRMYNPVDRVRCAPGFSWHYLVRTAANIASAIDALHSRGYVVGDVNESNILVTNTALVTMVDCDSMQVPNPSGTQCYRCPVGRAEFTPPELNGVDFAAVDRTAAHDNFALGVLLFLLLMEGVHPYSGVWNGAGDSPVLEDRIRLGLSPYVPGTGVGPMPVAPPIDVLPESVRDLVTRCFGAGHANPHQRPGAHEWLRRLRSLEANLNTCGAMGNHVYSSHLGACPWCRRAKLLGGFDGFGTRALATTPRVAAASPPVVTPLIGAAATGVTAPAIVTAPVTASGGLAPAVVLAPSKEVVTQSVRIAFKGLLWSWLWYPLLSLVFEAFGSGAEGDVLAAFTYLGFCWWRGMRAAQKLHSTPAQPRQAVVQSTTAGAAIVGSKVRMVYHRPGCKWATRIWSQNYVSFSSAADAQAAGYRACSVCSP